LERRRIGRLATVLPDGLSQDTAKVQWLAFGCSSSDGACRGDSGEHRSWIAEASARLLALGTGGRQEEAPQPPASYSW
jgi:hypothetical protein